MNSDRNKKLAKDIIIYGIGNIGSKFLAFLLFPLLSFFMKRGDFGYYDLSFEAILFLLPITTLQMRESTFRLLIDNKDETYRKNILSTTLFIEGIIFAIVLVIALFLPHIFNIQYFHLIILSIYVYSFYEIYIQSIRAIYSASKYALIGIITSFLTVVLILLFFFVFKRGIEGLFIGNILSRILAILIIELPRREFIKSISIKHIGKKYAKEIFNYSIPMLVTAVAFGIIASSGKFIVNSILGVEYNGDLAAAGKFMTIILILGITFYQAWQVTAVKNYKEHGSEKFFSDVFNKYAVMLCLLVLCISFGLRTFKFILLDSSYHQSIDLIYIYSVSAIFYCFALFFEIIFQCTKQTSKILYSILTCAIISPLLSIVLTKYFGLIGNVTALLITYAYLFTFRYFQTKSILPIRFNKDFFLSILLLIGGGILFYGTHNTRIDFSAFFIAGISSLYFLFISRKYISKKK